MTKQEIIYSFMNLNKEERERCIKDMLNEGSETEDMKREKNNNVMNIKIKINGNNIETAEQLMPYIQEAVRKFRKHYKDEHKTKQSHNDIDENRLYTKYEKQVKKQTYEQDFDTSQFCEEIENIVNNEFSVEEIFELINSLRFIAQEKKEYYNELENEYQDNKNKETNELNWDTIHLLSIVNILARKTRNGFIKWTELLKNDMRKDFVIIDNEHTNSDELPIVLDAIINNNHRDIISTYSDIFNGVDIVCNYEDPENPWINVQFYDKNKNRIEKDIVIENGDWYLVV